MAVEQLLGGFTVAKMPHILELYLLCCPSLDFNFRFLPKAGGILDQDYTALLGFRIIEQRISEWHKRQDIRQKEEIKETQKKKRR